MYNGLCCNQDRDKAMALLEEILPEMTTLARQGDIGARVKLGVLYCNRYIAKGSIEKGLEYLRQGAEAGIFCAIRNLAYCYFEGRGIEKNVAEGERLLISAAERGDCKARLILSNEYLYGTHLAPDNAKAAKWLKLMGEHKEL